MDCNEVSVLLLDRRRGLLDEGARRDVDEHVAGCAACSEEDAADRLLSTLLEERLPRPKAPESLKRELEGRWSKRDRKEQTRTRTGVAWGLLGMAAGVALAITGGMTWRGHAAEQAALAKGHEIVLAEAVNDHLRLLYSEHPYDVLGPDTHVVKPFFAGRLDFAPATVFTGDAEFPLEGGSVSYFVDRKAAALVFKRHLHVVTLLVFEARNLAWPTTGLRPLGRAEGTVETSRGFHVVTWHEDDLGYALVSDLEENELARFGAKIAGPATP